MKKAFLCLLYMASFALILACIVGKNSNLNPDYPLYEELDNQIAASFSLINEASETLWAHPEYFDTLMYYEGWQRAHLRKRHLDESAYGDYFSAQEWESVRQAYQMIEPGEVYLYKCNALQTNNGEPYDVRVIVWRYNTKTEDNRFRSQFYIYSKPTIDEQDARAMAYQAGKDSVENNYKGVLEETNHIFWYTTYTIGELV